MREDYSGHLADLVAAVGGKENIIYITHCATRLRLSLQDNHKVNLEEIGNLERVKGVFNVGDQLQIIYGAGRVNEVCQALKETLSLDEANLQSSQQRQKPLQRFVKSISDVFLEIMPSILAAALLMGLTSLLTTKGLFGDRSIVEMYPQISGLNRLIAIASSGIFALLPMVVAWSATRRYGGRPALGLAIGAIMVHPGLVDAFSAASGNAAAETISIFGLPVELVGFQGGIIIALMIGYTVAWLDQYFNRKLPDIIKFVLSPMLTILLSSLLLFTIIGPFGRLLGSGITGGLLWMAEYLGIFGYMIFGAVQQLIVITGLHHTFGAIEGQLLASTGRDFLNPLMSVALMGQGGAVVGYMLLHFNDKKVQTLCVSAFTSILFGISEPALFGVNLKYRFPLMAGCVAGAAGAAWVYLSKLTAVGYGTTALPGITIVDPANHGHVNYVVAHLLALTTGAILTYIAGKFATRAEC
ncbi:PTS transporter subunit EIIC [Pseudocitrobacter faecalis]|uniref:PTS transporter subunit EIIC n=1 Tax=Pseudocitrobacter faecalis TaxID=1398493 RepID=UPI001677B04E|nr:PTS transporter subunit EIIC [Pseudocitrobacter faecalis]GHD89572.1 PTS sucrose transporter subunit IIBC [Pseudocitrobacter faecalis]